MDELGERERIGVWVVLLRDGLTWDLRERRWKLEIEEAASLCDIEGPKDFGLTTCRCGSLSHTAFGCLHGHEVHAVELVAALPTPMVMGKVRLEDGRSVSGFLCEPIAVDGAENITAYGGWRAYLADR